MTYVHLVLEILGTFTGVVATLGVLFPNGRLGAFCRKAGPVLREAKALAEKLEK